MAKQHSENRYHRLLEWIFRRRYRKGAKTVPFGREDIEAAVRELGVDRPKNLGDVVYSPRYRSGLPDSIRKTAPKGSEWIIEGTGRAEYVFRLVRLANIVPNESLLAVKIPDATPEIVAARALSDEQSLLAKIRYNRLLDVFLGLAAYSLQNHLRSTVRDIGQIEIDELYAAVDKHGRQYVLPVQAKGGNDRLSVVQVMQDSRWCAENYADLVCRPISAQFTKSGEIALFELCLEDGEVRVVDERHYRLVPASEISGEDLAGYRSRSPSR